MPRRRSVPAPPAPPPPARPPGLGTHSHAVGRAIYSAGRCCYGNPYSKGVGLRLSRGAMGARCGKVALGLRPPSPRRWGGLSARSAPLRSVPLVLEIDYCAQMPKQWGCKSARMSYVREASPQNGIYALFCCVWKNP